MRSVLVIAQRFPPADGPDARWIAELVCALPAHGWRATVLTKPVQMGLLSSTTPDWAALSQVSRSADLVRIPSPEVLRITPRVDRFLRNTLAWTPGALAIAALLHRAAAFEAIFAIAPPYTSIGLAHALGRVIRRPHLAALREGWRPSPGSRAARAVQLGRSDALARAARVFDVDEPLDAAELACSLDAAVQGA